MEVEDQESFVPITKAVEILESLKIAHELDDDVFDYLKYIHQSLDTITTEQGEYIKGTEFVNFIKNFQSYGKSGGTNLDGLSQRRGMRIEKPVDIIEFVESPHYYKQDEALFQTSRDTLRNIWKDPDRYIEVVFTGAESIGKSYLSECNLAYMVYLLSCYENPQLEFGLAPGSSIIFVQQSVTLTKARKVLLDQFAARIRQSPYFREHFMFDPQVKSELRFPNNITVMPLGGSDTAAIGLNVFGGCFPKGQRYLLADGTIGNIEDVSEQPNRKVLTTDKDNHFFHSKNNTRTVCTGFKRLVKLHFDNGDSIVCTPEQKFKDLNHNWVEAQNAHGKSFKFTSMQDMRNEGYLSDAAFNFMSQNGRQRIQEEVPVGEAVRCGATKTAAGQERPEGLCNLSDLWEPLQDDNGYSSIFPQNHKERIQEKVSKCSYENSGDQRDMVGAIQKSCSQTTQRPEVQESIAERHQEGCSIGLEKDPRIDEGSRAKKTIFRNGKEKMGWDVERRPSVSHQKRTFRYSSIPIPEQEQRGDKACFKNGDNCSVFIRLQKCILGIRTGYNSLLRRWKKTSLYSRFQSQWEIYRSEREMGSPTRQELEIKTASSLEFAYNHDRDIEKSKRNFNTRYVVPQKDNKNKLGGANSLISAVWCTFVEDMGFSAPVYDVEEVEETHSFMVATQAGFLTGKNCIDEMNFMARTTNSVLNAFSNEDEYDQAEKLYGAIIRRIKGRFARFGRIPGKLFLISARNYPGDFTSRKVEEAKTDDSIYIMSYAQWEALPQDRFSGDKFLVEVGNDYKQSRIIQSREEATEESDIIEVPVEYRKDFERDIENALKALAGIATGPKNRFIPQRELIVKSYETYDKVTGGKTLFKQDIITFPHMISLSEPMDWTHVVDMEYIDECIIDPTIAFAVHADIGVTQCNAGLAIGRVLGFNNLSTYNVYSERAKSFVEIKDVMAPVIIVDGLLAISSPHGGEIDLDLITDLILFLKSKLNVRWGTADSYQSTSMLQAFRKHQIRSGIVSVEVSTAPYITLKQAIKDERILYPNHSVGIKELRELERDSKQDKIVKPAGGSKDVADALASMVHILTTKEGSPQRASMMTGRSPLYSGRDLGRSPGHRIPGRLITY